MRVQIAEALGSLGVVIGNVGELVRNIADIYAEGFCRLSDWVCEPPPGRDHDAFVPYVPPPANGVRDRHCIVGIDAFTLQPGEERTIKPEVHRAWKPQKLMLTGFDPVDPSNNSLGDALNGVALTHARVADVHVVEAAIPAAAFAHTARGNNIDWPVAPLGAEIELTFKNERANAVLIMGTFIGRQDMPHLELRPRRAMAGL